MNVIDIEFMIFLKTYYEAYGIGQAACNGFTDVGESIGNTIGNLLSGKRKRRSINCCTVEKERQVSRQCNTHKCREYLRSCLL